MKAGKLDPIDLKILGTLQRDGRLTNQRLSEQVHLSPRACLDRVRRLEAVGIITRYMAVVDPRLVVQLTIFFAEISLKDHTQRALAGFERRIRTCPEVVDCYLVSGPFDYLARIACRDIESYRLLTEAWADDPTLGVSRIVTNIVLHTVREFGGYPLPDDGSPILDAG
ncbi:MAG: Lrp/AsnC family transcriptional regulator [Azospirillaceae bacterium]|nr:Lrp/AsnC family transcriptional regulator [Azospirillaceae bacterium]